MRNLRFPPAYDEHKPNTILTNEASQLDTQEIDEGILTKNLLDTPLVGNHNKHSKLLAEDSALMTLSDH